jgi:uncharacterized membrane protein YcaP (DUF421 family)
MTMDPLGIAARVLVSYTVLLGLVRASGKRSVRHGTPFDFVIALIVGDMVDDAIWAEVELSRFLVGVVTLFATHWVVEYASYRASASVTR